MLFACLIPLLFSSGLKWNGGGRAISFLAILSYPFYLVQVPVKNFIHGMAPHLSSLTRAEFLATDWAIAAFATIGSFIVSLLLLKYQSLLENKYFKRNCSLSSEAFPVYTGTLSLVLPFLPFTVEKTR